MSLKAGIGVDFGGFFFGFLQDFNGTDEDYGWSSGSCVSQTIDIVVCASVMATEW